MITDQEKAHDEAEEQREDREAERLQLVADIDAALTETARLRNAARGPGRHEVFMALNYAVVSLRDALRQERKLTDTK